MSVRKNFRRTKFILAINGVVVPCRDWRDTSSYEANVIDTIQSPNVGFAHGPMRYTANFEVLAIGDEAKFIRALHNSQSLCQMALGMRQDGGEWSFAPGESWEDAEITDLEASGHKIGDVPTIQLSAKALRYTDADGVQHGDISE